VSKSITMAQAAEDWIESVALEKREASTLARYHQHARHIAEHIGKVKLAASLHTACEQVPRSGISARRGAYDRNLSIVITTDECPSGSCTTFGGRPWPPRSMLMFPPGDDAHRRLAEAELALLS
jgi:hypothetical protein